MKPAYLGPPPLTPYDIEVFGGDMNRFQPVEQYYGYTAPALKPMKKYSQEEKDEQAEEAMEQFNLYSFQRAAPGTIFGQGDSGFQSPRMKAQRMGFRNVYNSLFGRGPNSNINSFI